MTLEEILKGVSRSFYLSLRFLPRSIRPTMSLAFLACKAPDTIADTKLVPLNERLDWLNRYRELFETPQPKNLLGLEDALGEKQADPYERGLLSQLEGLLEALQKLPSADWALIRSLVSELTQGMKIDLTRFPGETEKELQSFQTEKELEQYTYYVAGCVGRFWTKVLREHFGFAKKWNQGEQEKLGENFGKGLQRVNILRDLPRDLRRGRCYLPNEQLKNVGVTPKELLYPNTLLRVRPYFRECIKVSRQYLHCGEKYAQGFPGYAVRQKWVVLTPMNLGFQTLQLLEHSNDWLKPEVVHKVGRVQVYETMFSSIAAALRIW